ncbi:MAG TPA: phosphatidylcholine/phosphatidylserine synthase [Pyrinomonadaceae bacterium]|nr:phosphatidylcholine/phosphatidylserine synthase [Pyrinomonadaceae bacterium]
MEPLNTSETTATGDGAAEAPARRPKKGLYLIPSALTAANLGLGFYAIVSIMRGYQLLGGPGGAAPAAADHFGNAAVAIFFAILFDMLDGRIARLTRTTTEIGVQFDSIADVITFCIAPALLAYAWGYSTTFGAESDLQRLGFFVSFMYVVSGAYRLARYNIQSSRPRVLVEGTAKLDKNSFVGLPTPAAAATIAALAHFAPRPLVTQGDLAPLYGGLLMVLVGALALLMVSTLRYPSFKAVDRGRRGTRYVLLLIAAVGMLLWLYSRYVLLALWGAYVLYGLLRGASALSRRTFRRRGDPAAE